MSEHEYQYQDFWCNIPRAFDERSCLNLPLHCWPSCAQLQLLVNGTVVTPAATCICTAFLVFNSPQLTVSIATGWEELKTENDIQDIWCTLCGCRKVSAVWDRRAL